MSLLQISGLHVRTQGKEILRGLDLSIDTSETVALLGPNGSGKSTLASVLAGHPAYEVTAGTILYQGADLLAQKPEERARAGIFLAFQYPHSVAGVTLGNFLRLAYNATHEPVAIGKFLTLLKEKMDLLKLPHEFMQRYVNDGFSGGEKKRAEMLQLSVLEPRLAILDETDSGLDVDALKVVGNALKKIRTEQPQMSMLVITHHQRLLEYVAVDRVAVMKKGKVVKEGQHSMLEYIERQGFDAL